MSIKENAKKHIVNIIELVVNLVILIISAGRDCIDCSDSIRNQFTEATIFGYFIVNCFLFLNIFFDKEFNKNWRYLVAALGLVLFLITGCLVLAYVDDFGGYSNSGSYASETIAIGCLCLVMVILYIVEIVLIYKDEDE